MEISVENSPEMDSLFTDLSEAFPNYKVRYPIITKKAINVVDNFRQVVIKKKDDNIIVVGNIDLMKPWIFIVFITLFVLSLLGGLIFYLILFLSNKKKIKALEEEVINQIETLYGTR